MRKILILVLVVMTFAGFASGETWYNTGQTVELDAQDRDSGVQTTYYCVDQSDSCDPTEEGQEYTAPFGVDSEGINYVRYQAVDNVGNEEDVQKKHVRIDYTDPGTTDDYSGEWENTTTVVDLSCNDPENPNASGCGVTEYCVDQSNSCTPDEEGNSVTFDEEGEFFLRYHSTDNAGNQEAINSVEVKMDFTDPDVLVSGAPESQSRQAAEAEIVCDDHGLSGCEESTYAFDIYDTPTQECKGNLSDYDTEPPFEVKKHSWVCAIAQDKAGNWKKNNAPVEFDVGSISTELFYPGAPDTVVTGKDRDVHIILRVGNEREECREIEVSTEGVPASFQDGSNEKTLTLTPLSEKDFNIVAEPESKGINQLDLRIEDLDNDFTVQRTVDIKVQETEGAGQHEVPGMSMIQLIALASIAGAVFLLI